MLRVASPNLDLGHTPDDPRHFNREVAVFIEATDEEGCYEASFRVEICTPSWLLQQAERAGWTWGRRRLVVPQWAPSIIERAVASLLAPAVRLGWTDLIRELEQYWEEE